MRVTVSDTCDLAMASSCHVACPSSLRKPLHLRSNMIEFGPFTVVMPDARLNQSKTQEAFRHATGMRRCAIVLRRRRHGRQTVSQHLRRVPGKQSRTDPSDKGACCRCSSSQTPRQLLGSTRAFPYTSVRHIHPECRQLRARRNTRKGFLPRLCPWFGVRMRRRLLGQSSAGS